MRSINLREAKASLSEIVKAAELGEPVTLTRHGKAAAVIIPMADAARLYPSKPNFVDLLFSMPEGLEFERNQSRGREVDL